MFANVTFRAGDCITAYDGDLISGGQADGLLALQQHRLILRWKDRDGSLRFTNGFGDPTVAIETRMPPFKEENDQYGFIREADAKLMKAQKAQAARDHKRKLGEGSRSRYRFLQEGHFNDNLGIGGASYAKEAEPHSRVQNNAELGLYKFTNHDGDPDSLPALFATRFIDRFQEILVPYDRDSGGMLRPISRPVTG